MFRLVTWAVSPLDRLENEITRYLKPFIEAKKEEIKDLEKHEVDRNSVRNSLPAIRRRY